jgi:hypothetical protein
VVTERPQLRRCPGSFAGACETTRSVWLSSGIGRTHGRQLCHDQLDLGTWPVSLVLVIVYCFLLQLSAAPRSLQSPETKISSHHDSLTQPFQLAHGTIPHRFAGAVGALNKLAV